MAFIESFINKSIINGVWFKAHGSRLVAQGSWLMAKKNVALGPGPGGPSANFFLVMSPEP